MLFWTIVITLITLALLILLLPLMRKKALPVSDVEQRNILIAREKLADLKRQLAEGALTQQQFDEQFKEVELGLKNDLDFQQKQHNATQGRWIIVVLLVFVPALSLTLYALLGDPDAPQKLARQQQLIQQQQQAQANIDKMVAGLAERLKQNPDDAEGWVMLGRSYLYMKRYPEAAAAYAEAKRLKPNDVDVLLQYADALAAARGGQLAGEPAGLIARALELQPNNQTALWLSGLAHVEAGELNAALIDWRKLQTLVDKQSQSYQKLAGLIQVLQEKTGQAVTQSNAAPGVEINVQVDVLKAFKKQLNPDDTVFIYARALNGPKMPLAIVRKQIKDLPLTVTLNDAMAMMPAMKLSAFKQVEVVARISKTGNAMSQPGDFIGKKVLTHLQAKQRLSIMIDQVKQ